MFLIRWKLKTKKKAQNRHRGEANTRRTRKHLIVLETRRQAREESGESNRDAFDGKNQVSTGIEPADPWYRTSKGRYRTGAGEEGVLLMPAIRARRRHSIGGITVLGRKQESGSSPVHQNRRSCNRREAATDRSNVSAMKMRASLLWSGQQAWAPHSSFELSFFRGYSSPGGANGPAWNA